MHIVQSVAATSGAGTRLRSWISANSVAPVSGRWNEMRWDKPLSAVIPLATLHTSSQQGTQEQQTHHKNCLLLRRNSIIRRHWKDPCSHNSINPSLGLRSASSHPSSAGRPTHLFFFIILGTGLLHIICLWPRHGLFWRHSGSFETSHALQKSHDTLGTDYRFATGTPLPWPTLFLWKHPWHGVVVRLTHTSGLAWLCAHLQSSQAVLFHVLRFATTVTLGTGPLSDLTEVFCRELAVFNRTSFLGTVVLSESWTFFFFRQVLLPVFRQICPQLVVEISQKVSVLPLPCPYRCQHAGTLQRLHLLTGKPFGHKVHYAFHLRLWEQSCDDNWSSSS